MTDIFVLKYHYEPVINLPLHIVQYAFAAPIVLWHNSKTPDVLKRIVNVAAENDIVPRLGEEIHYIHHHYHRHYFHHCHHLQLFLFYHHHKNNLFMATGGARTLDITQAVLQNILKSKPIFGFTLGSTLNEALSPLTISVSCVPAHNTTLILSPDKGNIL